MTRSSDGINSVKPTQLPYAAPKQAPAEKAECNKKFDSWSVSTSCSDKDEEIRKALISRISTEIKTATTTGDLNQLQKQIESGEYKIDPEAIAGSILFAMEKTNER